MMKEKMNQNEVLKDRLNHVETVKFTEVEDLRGQIAMLKKAALVNSESQSTQSLGIKRENVEDGVRKVSS